MASDLDLNALRALVAGVANRIAQAGRHVDLPDAFSRVGLPVPEETGNTKAQRAQLSVDALTDKQLPVIARAMLAHAGMDAGVRNTIQDILWAGEPSHEIPKRTRREIARDLDLDEFLPAYGQFKAMLADVWNLGTDPFAGFGMTDSSLGGQIDQHVARNADWSAAVLFNELGAFTAPSRRFALFVEGLVSGETLPDEAAQRRVVALLNPHLSGVGLQLRQTGIAEGYPVFVLMATRAHGGRPKNLIFASRSKPDLRLSDTIDNEVEILSGADQVLVYDRPITSDGLRWRDLQAWWKDAQSLDSDEAAKKGLWRRLRESLPETSPPQQMLFQLFHEIHRGRTHDLPALLPEVWLHWDPRTLTERGARAMLNLRMDFLMLLPGGHRIVLEVDGMHHYAAGRQADPAVYAATMRGDRELKLARYDVFRFGAAELSDEQSARPMLQAFFDDLFRTYQVR